MRTAFAAIDLNAIRHNFQTLKAKAPNSRLVAVIKANAYGHGALQVAKALPDADAFAVARIGEAVTLREGGVKQPILLLEGCFSPGELVCAAEHDFHTVVHNEEQITQLEQADLCRPLTVWIKVDTGMHRLGITPKLVEHSYKRLSECASVADPIGFVSHYSCADELDRETTQAQIDCFESAVSHYPGPKSLSNSAGVLHWPQGHYDWIRPGIALYGVAPRAESCGIEEGLKPVMTLQSTLIAVRSHKAGEPVGYGENWVAEQDTTIGVVAMGYGDGYPRMAPNGTPVIVNGRRVPLVGRVSMDMLTVDLGPNAKDQVGDPVELFGANLPVEEVSRHIGTLGYELVIKLTERVEKVYQTPCV